LTAGSLLLQHTSNVKQGILDAEGSCAPFQSWPDVDNGVTCSSCMALVLTAPYGGRCDRYCESFAHVCVAAAEEQNENCQVKETKRCDEEIQGTSDMLCTCEQQSQSPAPAPSPSSATACYGELAALAVVEGNPVGRVQTHSADACKSSCTDNDQCQSVSFCPQWGCFLKDRSFNGDEATSVQGDCKTYYKTPCGGAPLPVPAPMPVPSGAQIEVKVVSYNLYWWNAFGQNPWKGTRVSNNIRDSLQADVLGVQECDDPSLIQSRTGYAPASPFKGAQGVLIKPSLFEVGNTGFSDLQATGKWGPRYVTWAQLTHKASGRTFWHFNTHWCVHSGNGRTCSAQKRFTGAQNMLAVIRQQAGSAPVVITGDFNAGMGESGPRHFLQNGFSLAVDHWVDAVFYSTAHWQKSWTGTGDAAHSDHRPVMAELLLK